jgi:hypothetical protein
LEAKKSVDKDMILLSWMAQVLHVCGAITHGTKLEGALDTLTKTAVAA